MSRPGSFVSSGGGSGVRKSFLRDLQDEEARLSRRKLIIRAVVFVVGALLVTGAMLLFFLDLIVSIYEILLLTQTSCFLRSYEVQHIYLSPTEQRWRAVYQVNTEYKDFRDRIALPTEYEDDGMRDNYDQAYKEMIQYPINSTYACWAPDNPAPFNPESDFIGEPLDFIYTSYPTGDVKVSFWLLLVLAILMCLVGAVGMSVPAVQQMLVWRETGWPSLFTSNYEEIAEHTDSDEEMGTYRPRKPSIARSAGSLTSDGDSMYDSDEETGGKRSKRQKKKQERVARKLAKAEEKRQKKKEKERQSRRAKYGR